MNRWCLAGLLATVLAVAPAQAATVAITGATVHTASGAGSIEDGTVLIREGRIVAVGRDVDIPADATRVDARGKFLTPGLIDPYSYIGLVEVSLEPVSADNAVANDRFGASLDAADAINPHSVLIPVNRIEGVTRAIVAPAGTIGGVISGRSAAINLGDAEQPVDRRHVAVHAVFGEAGAVESGNSRLAALARLREALAEAQDYGQNRQAWERAGRRDYRLSHYDLEALQPVLRGEMPLVVAAHRASDIRALVELATEFELKLIVAGGAEAWMVAGRLATAGVPVILDPLDNLPSRFESLGATLENAARLHAAGVRFAFSVAVTASRSHNARNLSQGAGVAVANGLPWEAGLAALTASTAEIFGLEGIGQLQPGFEADVVIWDGDPLELTSYPDAVYIKGQAVPMVSRHTLLRDRYMERLKLGR